MSAESVKNNEKTSSNTVTITLPPKIIQAVDDHLDGTIGNSRSDAIKTALAIYLSERGLLDEVDIK